MKRCCVCGKKASFIVNGLYWCRRHVDYAKGSTPKIRRKGKKMEEVDLELAWV